jgi:hypothetical protein
VGLVITSVRVLEPLGMHDAVRAETSTAPGLDTALRAYSTGGGDVGRVAQRIETTRRVDPSLRGYPTADAWRAHGAAPQDSQRTSCVRHAASVQSTV